MFNNTSYHGSDINTNVTTNSFVQGSIDHSEEETFFVNFHWNSEIAKNLMGHKPFYQSGCKEYRVKIIRMITMLDQIVAELKIIK